MEKIECPICYENNPLELISQSCSHKFCKNCINKITNNRCPYCRIVINRTMCDCCKQTVSIIKVHELLIPFCESYKCYCLSCVKHLIQKNCRTFGVFFNNITWINKEDVSEAIRDLRISEIEDITFDLRHLDKEILSKYPISEHYTTSLVHFLINDTTFNNRIYIALVLNRKLCT